MKTAKNTLMYCGGHASPSQAGAFAMAGSKKKRILDELIWDATQWLVEESRRQGTKTLGPVSLSGGPSTDYDHDKLAQLLEDRSLFQPA